MISDGVQGMLGRIESGVVIVVVWRCCGPRRVLGSCGDDPEEELILISGRIPPETTLFSTSSIKSNASEASSSGTEDGSASIRKLNVVHSMGKAKRNTVRRDGIKVADRVVC